jgi:hypothetical protein
MPSITIKMATIDGVGPFILVDSTRKHVHHKTGGPPQIIWNVNNRTAQAMTVALVDFKGDNGGTPFLAAPPAPTPVGATAVAQIAAPPDGDVDVYEYRIVVTIGQLIIQVEDPELDIEP